MIRKTGEDRNYSACSPGTWTGVKPYLTGFVAPVLSAATHKGHLHVGDLTGSIYKVRG